MAKDHKSPQEKIERQIREEIFFIVSHFQRNFIQPAAVGCERLAKLYLQLDNKEISDLYVKQAMLYYEGIEHFRDATRLAQYLGDRREKIYSELESLYNINIGRRIVDKKIESKILSLLISLEEFLESDKTLFNIVQVIKDSHGVRIVHVYPELDE